MNCIFEMPGSPLVAALFFCTIVQTRMNVCLFVCLCWGLTSQSTIFQSCRDGAIASWVINQYFRGVKCLAQGHITAAVGFEPPTFRSGVRHSTTKPPRSPKNECGSVHYHGAKCIENIVISWAISNNDDHNYHELIHFLIVMFVCFVV